MLLEFLQQPVVHAATGEVAGVELLSRLGGQPPSSVLGSNTSGWLALDMGSLAHIRGGCVLGRGRGMVFVNLSRHIARHPWSLSAFLSACQQAMERSWVDIVVELDEEITLPDWEIVSLAHHIRSLGMQAAMDDHRGSPACYQRSRLACWDLIKVCAQNRPIESACVDIQNLAASGVPIVAEAIETASARRAVVDAGATYIQGWHTGYPVSVWEDVLVSPLGSDGTVPHASGIACHSAAPPS